MKDISWDNISGIIKAATDDFYTKHPDMMAEVMALNKMILDGIAEYFPEEEKKKYKLVNDNDGYKKEIQLMKIAKSVDVSDDERGSMKKELKKYIKEIDKCMALLNK